METTNLSNLKINVLTPEQYETAEKNANELYLIGNNTTFLSTVTKEYVDNSKVTVDTALNANSSNPIMNSAVTAALDAKQSAITGGASTITSSNLTINRALISDSSGKVAVSAVTSTELGCLDGITSNIQTQLNNKVGSSHNHTTSQITDFATAVSNAVANSGSAKVQAGTYVGTGTTNVSLTFNFEPKLVMINGGYFYFQGPNPGPYEQYVSPYGWVIWSLGITNRIRMGESTAIAFTISGNTLSWVIEDNNGVGNNFDTRDGLNYKRRTYNYIAIG